MGLVNLFGIGTGVGASISVAFVSIHVTSFLYVALIGYTFWLEILLVFSANVVPLTAIRPGRVNVLKNFMKLIVVLLLFGLAIDLSFIPRYNVAQSYPVSSTVMKFLWIVMVAIPYFLFDVGFLVIGTWFTIFIFRETRKTVKYDFKKVRLQPSKEVEFRRQSYSPFFSPAPYDLSLQVAILHMLVSFFITGWLLLGTFSIVEDNGTAYTWVTHWSLALVVRSCYLSLHIKHVLPKYNKRLPSNGFALNMKSTSGSRREEAKKTGADSGELPFDSLDQTEGFSNVAVGGNTEDADHNSSIVLSEI